MEYGLIGGKLSHSFSKEIHESAFGYSYELCELTGEMLEVFMAERRFKAVNVTIPYKEKVIPMLDVIDPSAEAIGAVNTVVNSDGVLYGYNTDFYGMKALLRRIGASLGGRKVLILGTGGTSKTARAVASSLGAGEIITVGRRGCDGVVTYDEAYSRHSDADYIINTTPCGMYPAHNGTENIPATPIDIAAFPHLKGVIDAVYNPIRTNLIVDAAERGIPAEGGLYMLVAQAVKAGEYFTSKAAPDGICDKVYSRIRAAKENIILIGMPGCGKSTVGERLSKMLGRPFVDTDDVIVETCGKAITEIFAEVGEDGFRDAETAAVDHVTSNYTGAVIATGGGAVLRDENLRMLKRCGRLYFINRPLDEIKPTPSRPLSMDREALRRRFEERYARYVEASDVEIVTDGVVEHTCQRIEELFFGE